MITPVVGKSGARAGTPGGHRLVGPARGPPAGAPACCIRQECGGRMVGAYAPCWATSGNGPQIGTGRTGRIAGSPP